MSDPPANTCPQCGATVAAEAPEGLCPRCVAALNLYADTAINGAAEVGTPPAPAPEEIAAQFPQLEIIKILGRGGMGVVYQARQKALGRLVALKLLAPERVADPKFAERFAHEAKALAALNHPGIVTIYDFGQAGGFYYLLMEFVDGVNLRQPMKAGRFTPEQALAIVPPVCEALQYAHEHGIVHRDIKPENLLLDKEGRVKIADFGIAKILGVASSRIGVLESQPAGTPQYMAPEQEAHRATDHRADIYSLGVVLYEMLTGEQPADQLQPPSKRVQVDVRIDEIVLRALEKTPELRYQTAAEFRTQVETLVSPHAAAPIGVSQPQTVPPRLLCCLLLVVISLGLLFAARHIVRPSGPVLFWGILPGVPFLLLAGLSLAAWIPLRCIVGATIGGGLAVAVSYGPLLYTTATYTGGGVNMGAAFMLPAAPVILPIAMIIGAFAGAARGTANATRRRAAATSAPTQQPSMNPKDDRFSSSAAAPPSPRAGRSIRRVSVIIVGIVCFASLMALRDELDSVWARAAVAGGAFIVLGYVFIVSRRPQA